MPKITSFANENELRFPATIVSIYPSTTTVLKGETFSISVYVDPGEPIIGVSFDYLYFDPTLIQANSVTEGNLFDPYNTFFNPGTIDNVNGEITYVYGITIPATGVTNSGYFCNISFTAQQKIGTSSFNLENVIISNASGGVVPLSINDGKVAVIWSTRLNFNETSGKNDYAIFGEAADANDNADPDTYDTPKPPEPIPPYIRAWFENSLPVPYDYLLKDYRHYPDVDKTWDLYVRWESTNTTSIDVIVAWDTSEIDDCEYTSMVLMRYDPFDDEWDFAADMLIEHEYVYSPRFFASNWLTDHFQINATGGPGNNPPYVPYNPIPSDDAVGALIDTNLSWTGGDPDGDPVTYDVYFGLSSPPSEVAGNQTAVSFDPGLLEYETLYYWQIVAWDNQSARTNGPIWSFTTMNYPNSAPVIFNESPVHEISNVERPPTELSATIEDIDNDAMNISILWKKHDFYHVGEWATLESYSAVYNGTYSTTNLTGNDWIWGNTTYTWSVNVTDGTTWINQTFEFTTRGSRYDVNNDDNVNFQDAGLVWVHRTSEAPYDGIYDVNFDGEVNFQDAGLTWINRD